MTRWISDFGPDQPLFRILRTGFWHCTSVPAYRQIRKDGFIKPQDGITNKYECYACQQLGAVSLFDFESHSEDIVLEERDKWYQFLGCARPVTVIIGFKREALSGPFIRYPDNKIGTTGNLIPWVEVCHQGPVPISAASRYLFVCPVDYSRFLCVDNPPSAKCIAAVQREYKAVVAHDESEGKKQHAKMWADLLADPEVQARIKKRDEAQNERPG